MLCQPHLFLFSLEFSIGFAMKIPMKKNAAANRLETNKRLQGLTATDMTHSYWWRGYLIRNDVYKGPRKLRGTQKEIKTWLNLPGNKTGISAPSNLHRLWLRCSILTFSFFYPSFPRFYLSFFHSTNLRHDIWWHLMTSDDTIL